MSDQYTITRTIRGRVYPGDPVYLRPDGRVQSLGWEPHGWRERARTALHDALWYAWLPVRRWRLRNHRNRARALMDAAQDRPGEPWSNSLTDGLKVVKP